MIQFNLLPESNSNEIKSSKVSRLIASVTYLIAGLAIIVTLVLLFETRIIQKHNINNNNNQISTQDSAINRIPDLNSILKINDAIKVLPTLYNTRPDVTRLSNYLSLITPAKVSLTTLTLDFKANTISVSGTADSINTINTFVDTLKFSEFSVDGSKTTTLAFSKVVLSSYSYLANSSAGQSFSITADFAPDIFATKNSNVQLIVPNKITTRSDIDQPTNLFNASASNTTGS